MQSQSHWFGCMGTHAWERWCNVGRRITIITVIIIYAFKNFGKHQACNGMEPHLHNSADLTRSALAPNDMRLAHFISGLLSAYRRDFKPQEKISIDARRGPVSHSQLRSSFSLKARTHWNIRVASPVWCASRLSFTAGVGLETGQRQKHCRKWLLHASLWRCMEPQRTQSEALSMF